MIPGSLGQVAHELSLKQLPASKDDVQLQQVETDEESVAARAGQTELEGRVLRFVAAASWGFPAAHDAGLSRAHSRGLRSAVGVG